MKSKFLLRLNEEKPIPVKWEVCSVGAEHDCWTLARGMDLPGFSLFIRAMALFP